MHEIKYDHVCHGMRDVFKGATPENAVRLREQTRSVHLETYPYLFPLPTWEGVEKVYNVRDFVMADALGTMCEDWGEYPCVPLSQVVRRLDSPPEYY